MQTYRNIFDDHPAATKSGSDDEGLSLYFQISPFMIFPEAYAEFAVYTRKGKDLILFTREGEKFTKEHKAILEEKGVPELFIQSFQRPEYDRYLEGHLGAILADDSIPVAVRSSVLYHLTTSILGEVFETDRHSLSYGSLDKLKNIVRSSLEFLSTGDAFRSMAPMLSHGYGVHTHSANVFIYCAAIVDCYKISLEEKLKTALGALLHDIGKAAIPKAIVNKHGKLNKEERDLMQTHPVRGVGICTPVFIGQTVIHCLLFHHEKMDGSGYPAGIQGSAIPLYPRIIGVADAFDTLTSDRYFYGDPLSARQALTVVGEEMSGRYDRGVIIEFDKKLRDAGID